jgi:hypothetical protein
MGLRGSVGTSGFGGDGLLHGGKKEGGSDGSEGRSKRWTQFDATNCRPKLTGRRRVPMLGKSCSSIPATSALFIAPRSCDPRGVHSRAERVKLLGFTFCKTEFSRDTNLAGGARVRLELPQHQNRKFEAPLPNPGRGFKCMIRCAEREGPKGLLKAAASRWQKGNSYERLIPN